MCVCVCVCVFVCVCTPLFGMATRWEQTHASPSPAKAPEAIAIISGRRINGRRALKDFVLISASVK